MDFSFEKPTNDYLRVVTASPLVAVADPRVNAQRILEHYEAAREVEAELVAFPELSLTGYTAGDLLFRTHVRERSMEALHELARATHGGPAMVVGVPVFDRGVYYNCAAVLAQGKIVGIVPKTHIPNNGEFYERRWFTSGEGMKNRTLATEFGPVPFGTDILFDINGTTVGLEICEDMFAPISPSSYLALSGAHVVVNLSASNEVIGKPDYRHTLVSSASAKLNCAYVYVSSGKGESVADTVFGGHHIIAELGRIVKERPPLTDDGGLVFDIDRMYIEHDRAVNTTFGEAAAAHQRNHSAPQILVVRVPQPKKDLHRHVSNSAHLPSDKKELDRRCEYIFDIMSQGLAAATHASTGALVLGLSGGLDSTLALLTCKESAKKLGKPMSFIHTATMPGKASSDRTQTNAAKFAEAIGTTHRTMPIGELSAEALEAIGHDGITENIAYENTQARMRTLLLMNYANEQHGMVVGTGDLSETLQGWCTYNGDHMSMYNPNAGVPKTLVRELVQWYAEHRADDATRAILEDILDTPISPELTGDGDLSQTTEDQIGPYELLDFFGKDELRYGSRPDKIGYLASLAFEGTYVEPTIDKWLGSYFARFTGSQWKREAIPNGTKLGTVSAGQRSDLRMPPNASRTWYL